MREMNLYTDVFYINNNPHVFLWGTWWPMKPLMRMKYKNETL